MPRYGRAGLKRKNTFDAFRSQRKKGGSEKKKEHGIRKTDEHGDGATSPSRYRGGAAARLMQVAEGEGRPRRNPGG